MRGYSIVYVDESGFAADSPRTHGYTEKGERCYAKKDWHAKGRINVVGAIIEFVFLTVCLFECNINSDIFYAWLTQDLLPKTPHGSVIVLDNATFHKRNDMTYAIRQAGCIPEFLPPYSPDLNPIEYKWSESKALRRRTNCSPYELFKTYDYATL